MPSCHSTRRGLIVHVPLFAHSYGTDLTISAVRIKCKYTPENLPVGLTIRFHRWNINLIIHSFLAVYWLNFAYDLSCSHICTRSSTVRWNSPARLRSRTIIFCCCEHFFVRLVVAVTIYSIRSSCHCFRIFFKVQFFCIFLTFEF